MAQYDLKISYVKVKPKHEYSDLSNSYIILIVFLPLTKLQKVRKPSDKAELVLFMDNSFVDVILL